MDKNPKRDDLRDVLLTKMSLIYANFFWLDEHEKNLSRTSGREPLL